MAEAITLARPYAKAVFGMAQQAGDFASWSDALGKLTLVVSDPGMANLLNSPKITSGQLADVVLDVLTKLDGGFGEKAQNLVRLLADNGRLDVVPAIAAQYEVLRNDAENTVNAEVRAAVQPTDAQLEAIRSGLAKKLGRDVKLNVSVDESLLGGALIQAGDLVIDGTVKTKLARLGTALVNS